MSIFRAARSKQTIKDHGKRVSTPPSTISDFHSEVIQDDEYAWSWAMAQALREAVEKKFNMSIELCSKYKTGFLGLCRNYNNGQYMIELRPTLRGNEAWRTYFHELAHAITPWDLKNAHGEEWKKSLVVIHEFWKEFLRSVEGNLKVRLIEMVTNYAYWRGRPIGLDENTDPWNRPWAKK